MPAKKDKSRRAVKNLRTGRIQLVNEKNLQVLKRRDMRECRAIQNKSGAWVEAETGDNSHAIAGSKDIQRIGQQLLNLEEQRQLLITSAFRLPGGEQYLTDLGVYDPQTNEQTITPVKPGGITVAEAQEASVGIEDVTEQLAAEAIKKPTRRRTTKKEAVDEDMEL